MLITDGELTWAKVIGRKRDERGELIGKYHPNPYLNIRIYFAEFPDGQIAKYSANIIAQAIYDSINKDGNDELLFEAIVDHEKVKMSDEQIPRNPTRQVTKGWNIYIMWNDSSTTWHTLIDTKRSFPVQLAQYAIDNNLQDEEAFRWWIKPTLNHRKRFIQATQAWYARQTHKFGVQVPTTVCEALKIDQETKTTFWYDAIQKEMANIRTAFKFLDENERVPPGHKWIKCHLIFDVKMDLTRKARYIAAGHMMNVL